jgi:mono/diheme cytochrome c family protein
LPIVKRVVTLAAVLAVGLTGCLGDDAGNEDVQRGKQLFAKAGCGDCHTLGEAGAKGKIGPSLDAIRPDFQKVQQQVTGGGPGMPAFGDRLSNDDIAAIASYVSEAAGESLDAVTAAYEPDDTRLEQCHGLQDMPCFQQAFANLAYRDGPGPALAHLERRMARDRVVAAGCHRIAHAMGGAGVKRLDDEVGKAFAAGTAVCSSGYYHGILEQSFSDTGDGEDELAEKARGLCKGGPLSDDTFLAFQCVHGLGHGLMLHTLYDLPLALDVCDRIGNQVNREACQGGVFMENFTTLYEVSSEWRHEDDLLFPCNEVNERRKTACYLIVTAYALDELDHDWRKVARVCRQAEPDWEFMCIRSFGRDAISQNAYDQDRARELCHLTGDLEGECVLSVALHIANEERGVRGAVRFCRDTPARLRVKCFAGIGSTAALLYEGPRLLEVCERVTSERRELFACLGGQPTQPLRIG